MALRFPAFETSTVVLRPEWRLASDLAMATWIKLCCQCSAVENGGSFGGAASWGEREWLSVANVTVAGVSAAVTENLCKWDGDSLLVMGYDNASESKVEKLRTNGQRGGRPRKSRKPNGFQKDKPDGSAKPKPLSSPFLSSPILTLPNPSPNGEVGAEKPAAPAAPTAKDFIAGFVEARKVFYAGETYRPTPRDAGAAKQLASNHSELLAEWAAVCRRYFACGKEFYRTERHPLSLLVSGLNAFTGEVKGPDPPNGKRRDVSVGHFAAPGPEFKYPSGDQEL